MKALMLASCLLLVIGMASPMTVSGQTVPGTLAMHATIASIGVVAPYTGDSNQNNQAALWYRPVGQSVWLAGHGMDVDRSAQQWRASLVYLTPATDYEVEVRFTDPDDPAPVTARGTVRTRPDYPATGSGGTIRYVPDQGSLQTVINAASAGDTVRIRAGTYHLSVELGDEDSGASGKYLTIEAVPGDHVVLDGSDPDLNDPLQDNWLPYGGASHVYYTDLPWSDFSCEERIGYVGEQRAGDGMRYLLYKGNSLSSGFLSAPPGKAFYDCDSNRLYVMTYDEDDPDSHEMHVSRYARGMYLAGADYVRIRNLEFRYYSTYGVYLGGSGADYNIIEGNTFHGIGFYQIHVGSWDVSLSSNNLIQDNQFYERGYRDSHWTWDMQYDHAFSVAVRLNFAGPGNVIRRNTLKGGSDGINVGWQSHNTDVYDNVIEEYMDDGIEVDDQPGYNIRVWGNTIRHCYSGISNQGWFRGDYWNAGPIYIFRNVIVGGDDPQGRTDVSGSPYYSGYAFKVGADQDRIGRLYYYHNTIYLAGPSTVGNGIQTAGGAYFAGLVTRNNLWSVNGRVLYLGYSTATNHHDLDYDNLHNAGTSTDDRFIRWSSSTFRNLTSFQTGTGQELHGISNNGTQFNPDLSLKRGSPEIDRGCVITGFNDRGPAIYRGQKPDIGAFEFQNVPDLSTSVKSVSPVAVTAGERVIFTVRVINAGAPLTSTVTMTDVVPVGVDYVPGTLTASSGTAWVDDQGAATVIHWQGIMDDILVVEVRFAADVGVAEPTALVNTARIDDGLGRVFNRSAWLIANGWSMYFPLTRKNMEGK